MLCYRVNKKKENCGPNCWDFINLQSDYRIIIPVGFELLQLTLWLKTQPTHLSTKPGGRTNNCIRTFFPLIVSQPRPREYFKCVALHSQGLERLSIMLNLAHHHHHHHHHHSMPATTQHRVRWPNLEILNFSAQKFKPIC